MYAGLNVLISKLCENDGEPNGEEREFKLLSQTKVTERD